MDFKLERPIKVHGANGIREIEVFTLRDPNAEDILQIGNPTLAFRNTDNNEVRFSFDGPMIRRYINRLSNHDPGVLAQLPPSIPEKVWAWLQRKISDIPEDEPEAAIKNSDAPSESSSSI